MAREVYILRHGQTDFNKSGIVQGGGVDSDLNEIGRMQGRAFYDKYKDIPFELVITSDLKRSQQTVADFIDAGLPHKIMPEVREMDWGIFEGKSTDSWTKEKYEVMIVEWDKGNYDARLEEGESAQELYDRVMLFAEELKKRTEDKILVCTHGRTLRCIVAAFKGMHLREMENVKHNNSGLFKLTIEDDAFSFSVENDITHLEEAKVEA